MRAIYQLMALPHMQIGIIGVLDSARERETAACAQSPFLRMAQASGVRIKNLNPIAFWGDGILSLPKNACGSRKTAREFLTGCFHAVYTLGTRLDTEHKSS